MDTPAVKKVTGGQVLGNKVKMIFILVLILGLVAFFTYATYTIAKNILQKKDEPTQPPEQQATSQLIPISH
jgi:TRAP-type mannitol/chloroaromatic compound transport system permease large subunit